MRVHESRSFALPPKACCDPSDTLLRFKFLSCHMSSPQNRNALLRDMLEADHIAKSEIHIIVRIETIKRANLKTLFRNHG
jgi:hypothetical protein